MQKRYVVVFREFGVERRFTTVTDDIHKWVRWWMVIVGYAVKSYEVKQYEGCERVYHEFQCTYKQFAYAYEG